MISRERFEKTMLYSMMIITFVTCIACIEIAMPDSVQASMCFEGESHANENHIINQEVASGMCFPMLKYCPTPKIDIEMIN